MRGARFRPIYGKTTAREAVAEGFATHEGGGRAREIRLQTHFGVGSLHERALWPVVPIVAQELPASPVYDEDAAVQGCSQRQLGGGDFGFGGLLFQGDA